MTQLLLFLVAADGLFTSVFLLFPLTSVLPIYLQLLLYDSTILFLIAVDRLQFSPIDICFGKYYQKNTSTNVEKILDPALFQL